MQGEKNYTGSYTSACFVNSANFNGSRSAWRCKYRNNSYGRWGVIVRLAVALDFSDVYCRSVHSCQLLCGNSGSCSWQLTVILSIAFCSRASSVSENIKHRHTCRNSATCRKPVRRAAERYNDTVSIRKSSSGVRRQSVCLSPDAQTAGHVA